LLWGTRRTSLTSHWMQLKCLVTFSDSDMMFLFTGPCENLEEFEKKLSDEAKQCVSDPKHYVLHYFNPCFNRFLLLSTFSQLSPDTNKLKFIKRVNIPNVCTETLGKTPSLPRDETDAWTEITSLPSPSKEVMNAVKKLFASTCPVTHFKNHPRKPKSKKGAPKAERETQPAVIVAHIVPKYNFANPTLLKVLHWGCNDVNKEKNLLLLHKTLESTFHELLWTFLPLSPVAVIHKGLQCHKYKLKVFTPDAVQVDNNDFFILRPIVFLPTHISRRALYSHAYHAHKKWGMLEALPPQSDWDAAKQISPAVSFIKQVFF
jgi:hypothetical protein